MGLTVVATALAAVVSGAYQAERAASAGRQQKRGAEEQKKANAQQAAQQEYERKQAVKQQLRKERVRQAQVMSAAEASGVSGSSLEATTIGSEQTIGAAGTAFATGATITAQEVSDRNQKAADYRSSAAFDLSQGQTGAAVGQAASLGFSAFKPSTSVTTKPSAIDQADYSRNVGKGGY